MSPEHEKQLFDRFAFFRPDRPLTASLMGFGFECGDGWFKLLEKLCEEIDEHLRAMKPAAAMPFEVIQVKEKFGGLRFYANWGTDAIDAAIDRACEASYHTCEVCGEPGSVRDLSYVQTLCEVHLPAKA